MATESSFNLSGIPPIFVLSANMDVDDRHELEEKLIAFDAPLTYDIQEARIVVGKVSTKRRAELELRMLKLWTDEASPVCGKVIDDPGSVELEEREPGSRPAKRRRTGPAFTQEQTKDAIVIDGSDDSSTDSESHSQMDDNASRTISQRSTYNEEPDPTEQIQNWSLPSLNVHSDRAVFVLKVAWIEEVLEKSRLIPVERFLVYSAVPKERPPSTPRSSATKDTDILPTSVSPQTPRSREADVDRPVSQHSILDRARSDAPVGDAQRFNPARRRFGDNPRLPRFTPSKEKATLLQQQTTDYESGDDSELPEPPQWVEEDIKYACLRRTPAKQANASFIEVLKRIRMTRELSGDEIGVRAYSTSIAALAAYPYLIKHPREILRIPGCEIKIANLWVEWKNNDGHVKEAEDAEKDERMSVLKGFYDIWGVGATTAREFYSDRGWRDRQDIIDYGWDSLTRAQQIGLKFYDEFLEGIPRGEVASIASIVKDHAVRVRDTGIEVLVVGGYRRGKELSGDVDIIVSHRRLEKTANLVNDIVSSLDREGWITHTLLVTATGTQRGQATLPYRGGIGGGHGFDTLDKALVVWQDPHWPGGPKRYRMSSGSKSGSASGSATPLEQDAAGNASATSFSALRKANPNPHRRVDIIASPWRTVGCAVLGWSGGTTFQRDIRRYAKNVKGWKFDSSGIRDRRTGLTLDIEGPDGVQGEGMGMVEAEKRVFEGMGLKWVPPEERCTH